jgi:hypothetical protein
MQLETLEDNCSAGTDTVHRTTPRLLWSMTDEGPEPARELMKAWLLRYRSTRKHETENHFCGRHG